MPKFYCEYCGIYLTHSSPAGRKQHSMGRKHISMKVEYYQRLVREHFFQPPPYTLSGAHPVPGAPPGIVPGNISGPVPDDKSVPMGYPGVPPVGVPRAHPGPPHPVVMSQPPPPFAPPMHTPAPAYGRR
ncbi:U1 zinc finger family protein [Babesia bovis T2Bo]|uniref:U1 zinc finger family protein n=1 Tax=Babesia bovis TaxID=5865 RepID=A7AMW3_BABBO|nr:U1 zinc finger family protein [Babesia bovis T2Bo]EDO07897.1 U1 zinc finger family protein [Babesia bovis T2Bo]|eukprot:XP_001611465.1 U1 zinc finger family protein [Babesia bovis T2Bo]